MRRLLIVGTAFLAALSTAAAARAQDESSYCEYSDFVSEADVAAYSVAVPGRTHFLVGAVGCSQTLSCRTGSYVIGKDRVLVSKIQSGWACALYAGQKRDTIGWLKLADLAKAPSLPITTDWEGTWSAGEDNQVTIARDARRGLRVDIFAVARGADGSEGRTGGFSDGALRIDGSRAAYSDAMDGGEPICVVRFRRVERYLFVVDNDRCGGMGVSLTGAYTRP
jgi:hypothetical protein